MIVPNLRPRLKTGLVVGLAIAVSACMPANTAPTHPIKPDSSIPTAPMRESTQKFRQTTILTGLERPWSMAWLPNGDMLITEKPGRLRLVQKGVLQPTAIAGTPAVMTEGQGGLLDIALHPQFAKNRWLYLTYAHGTLEANRTQVARATFDGKALRDLRVIFEASPVKSDSQHFGSRMLWLPDGTMLVSVGDGGNPPVKLSGELIRQQAQNLKSRLGKIVRINDDGSIPRDNPFVKNAKADPAIWSYGHRNIQGLAFDPIHRQVWETEHGARGGDELNRVEAGKNYGWPLVTYSKEYAGGEISQARSRQGLIDPKIVWTPAIAPSGLTFYNGNRFPTWKGDLFAGGLVAKGVRRIDLDGAGNVLGQQDIAVGQRVRDVRQGPDGLLYILTDESDGRLIRLDPAPG